MLKERMCWFSGLNDWVEVAPFTEIGKTERVYKFCMGRSGIDSDTAELSQGLILDI